VTSPPYLPHAAPLSVAAAAVVVVVAAAAVGNAGSGVGAPCVSAAGLQTHRIRALSRTDASPATCGAGSAAEMGAAGGDDGGADDGAVQSADWKMKKKDPVAGSVQAAKAAAHMRVSRVETMSGELLTPAA
jgi:hypothetical protein